jgi:hypothetical protein
MCGTCAPLPLPLMGEVLVGVRTAPLFPHPHLPPIVFGTRSAKEASCSFPPGGGRWGWGETRGRSAPLRRTPTPPSPVEGEGSAQRLPATLVPNNIDPPPPRGKGVLTDPCQPLAGEDSGGKHLQRCRSCRAHGAQAFRCSLRKVMVRDHACSAACLL